MGNNKKKVSPIDKKPLRRAGLSLWQKIGKKTLILGAVCFVPIAIWLGMVLGLVLSSLFAITYTIAVLNVLLIIWIVVAFIYAKRADSNLENLYRGLEGEIFVGELLESEKEPEWKILHDFIFKHRDGESNIDHIVIAPQGIFTIETKTVSKFSGEKEDIYYDGRDITIVTANNGNTKKLASPLEQAQIQAKEIQKFILDTRGDNIKVQPIVVYPGWFVKGTYENNKTEQKVWVCNPKFIKGLISNNQHVLSSEQMIRIYSAMAEHNRIS